MAHWEQFPMGNEQSSSNPQFDQTPPSKRPKTSDDGAPNPQINPPGKIFFKTRLCAKFRLGQCRNGENCNFAHGEEDRRHPPPNWQDLVSGRPDERGTTSVGNWEDDDKIIHRMKLCKKFYNGEECPYGERCNFLHKEAPKVRDSNVGARFGGGSMRESSAISIGTSVGPPLVQQGNGGDQGSGNGRVVVEVAGFDASRGNARPVYWKTRMCTKWEVSGHCPFAEKCHFAHGSSELQMSVPEPANLNSATPRPHLPGPVNQPETVISSSKQEGKQGKKCLLKWVGAKKINSIYADWLDDMPLKLPNEVEG